MSVFPNGHLSWLNEYIYQEALKVAFEEKQIPYEKEYYFQVSYHGHPLEHKLRIEDIIQMNLTEKLVF